MNTLCLIGIEMFILATFPVPLTASADRRTINYMLSPCELWPAFPIDAGFFYFQAVPQ